MTTRPLRVGDLLLPNFVTPCPGDAKLPMLITGTRKATFSGLGPRTICLQIDYLNALGERGAFATYSNMPENWPGGKHGLGRDGAEFTVSFIVSGRCDHLWRDAV